MSTPLRGSDDTADVSVDVSEGDGSAVSTSVGVQDVSDDVSSTAAVGPTAATVPAEDVSGVSHAGVSATSAAAWSARTLRASRDASEDRALAHRAQQRMVAVRLLVLVGVLTWAIFKMNPSAVKPAGRWELARPATVSERSFEGEVPPVVDLAAAMDVMDEVALRGGACPARGVLSVELGPAGLVRARLEGEGNLACLGTIVWAASWPRAQQAFLLDQSLARVAAP